MTLESVQACGNYRANPPEDPSALTVKMLLRELSNLREVLVSRMDGAEKTMDEKFNSIQTQFKERDTRTEQAAGAVKIAVDAALQAQKEAVGEQNKSSALAIAKSETSTTKQIDQIGVTIQNTTANLNDKIDDVKTRLVAIDGQVKLGKENKDDSRANIAIGVSVVMAAITVGTLLFDGKSPPPPAGGSVSTPQIIYVPAPQAAPTPIAK